VRGSRERWVGCLLARLRGPLIRPSPSRLAVVCAAGDMWSQPTVLLQLRIRIAVEHVGGVVHGARMVNGVHADARGLRFFATFTARSRPFPSRCWSHHRRKGRQRSHHPEC
jgi:hypothetical protein